MKKEEVLEIILNKMFELSGHDLNYQQLLGREDAWYNEYTITKEQEKEWLEFGIATIRKELGVPKYVAKKEMMWLHLNYGLKTIDK